MGSKCFRWAGLCLLVLIAAVVKPAAVSPNLVISQVYGAGSNGGALRTHDYVELFNRGTEAVSLDGLSIQYASATGTGNFGANSGQLTELPNVTLRPGQYFLVQQAGGTVGIPLPTPDHVDPTPIAMAAGAGKVALVTGTATLGCNGGSTPCPPAALARIVDLVGYGNANFSESGSPAPTISTTTAAFRAGGGCTDTDNNGADFTAATPAPRNTASAFGSCQLTLSIADVSVTEGDSGTKSATFTVQLSGPATAPVFFDIATADDTATTDDNDYEPAAFTGQTIPAGADIYTFSVIVNGDTTVEPAERFLVNVTSISGAAAGDTQGAGIITNDDVVMTPIHVIQGAGLESPIAGVDVITTGIVTARKNTGFFVQTPDGQEDANELTSEGIFVFTATAPAVAVGDVVLVQGTVNEFFSLTEIEASAPGAVSVSSSLHQLPATVTLTPAILNPAGLATQLERFEGMRLTAAALVSVAPTNEFGEIAAVLQGVARPMREPGIEASLEVPPDPVTALVDCCIPRWDKNRERIVIDTDGRAGAAVLTVTSNVTLSNVSGPLDFTFSEYKIVPESAPAASASMTAVAAPAPAANEFTIAGFNIENFANGTTQRLKAALAIRTVLRLPDVIGHVEIRSLADLSALATQVNNDAVAAGLLNPDYQAFLIPFGTGSQHVGFLVKASRVRVDGVSQERETETYINPVNGQSETLHDRPPLVLHATVDPAGVNPGQIIVVVNHLRSFIDVELVGGDGPRVRAKRTAQAESLAGLLQELQTLNANVPVISIGDYNAFEFSDGYTDPIRVITGSATSTDAVVVQASPDLVDPDFVNLTGTLPASERYSFIFEGTPQVLDHVIVNSVALRYKQRYVIARNNADFPDHVSLAGDASRPERNSDHDMPVAYFAFPGTPVVTLNGSATMTHEAFTPFVDPGATAHDDAGALQVTTGGAVNVGVPGEYQLTYTASNGYKTTSVTRIVRVVDSTPPAIAGVQASPDSLGAPNHKMIRVDLVYAASDLSGAPVCAVSVASNEPIDGGGDGHTSADWLVVDAHTVLLRAERSGMGTSRIYTLTVSCHDASGNTAEGTTVVKVAR